MSSLGRTLSALGLLAMAASVVAQPAPLAARNGGGLEWLECFEESVPPGLASVLVDDWLAGSGIGTAPEPSFRGRFAAVLMPCVIDDATSQEELGPVTQYALRKLGRKGTRERLLAMGISEQFLDRAVAIYRRELAGENTDSEIGAAADVEAERIGLSEAARQALHPLVALYADSHVALEKAPPEL